jgi:hypothetical protein
MLGVKTYTQDYVDSCRESVRLKIAALHLAVGDEIRLTQGEFVRLAEGFFAEIEKKYVPAPVAAGA